MTDREPPRPPQPPPPPNAEKLDPLLETLLARARPIIAEERGLNHRSRVKIQALGKKMKIPAAVVDQALQLLHGAPPVQLAIDPHRAETQYEKAFARTMTQKVSAIPGRILTTKIEEKAISIGTRKYQLSETQARNIIRRVAEELGVPRVTLTEAERHIEQEIADVIGDQTWIAGDKKDRLIRNGKRLGVTREQTESIIQRHLQFNFQQAQFERKLTDWLWIVAACILAGTGLALYVFFQLQDVQRGKQAEKRNEEKKRTAETEASTSPPTTTESPRWWDDSLKLLFEKTRFSVSGFPEVHDALKSDAPNRRAEAYAALFELGADKVNPEFVRERVAKVIPGLYQSEPDATAYQGLLRGFETSIKMPTGSIPPAVDFFRRAFWALELLNEIVGSESLEDEKVVAIQRMIEPLTGQTFDLNLSANARLETQRQILVEKYFSQLADVGDSAPAIAPQVFENLEELAGAELPADRMQACRYRFVASFLRADHGNWKSCVALITDTIDAGSPEQLAFFVDLMESTGDESLQLLLEELLMERAGLTMESDSLAELVNELREALDIPAVSRAEQKESRTESLQRLMLAFHDRWSAQSSQLDKRESAQLLLESAYLTTLVWLTDSPETEILDRLLEQGMPSLDQPDYVARVQGWTGDSGPDGGETSEMEDRAPTDRTAEEILAREQTNRAFDLLKRFRILQPEQRIDALRQIVNWASRRSQLTVEEADILAEYLFARKRADEQQIVLQSLVEFRHWPRLLIAAADLLEPGSREATGNVLLRDTCLSVASLLLDRDLTGEKENWESRTADRLVQRARELLLTRISRPMGGDGIDRSQVLQETIEFFYRLRVRSRVTSRPIPEQTELFSSLDFLIETFQEKLRQQENRTALGELEQQRLVEETLGGDLLSGYLCKQQSLLIALRNLSKSQAGSGPPSPELRRLSQLVESRLKRMEPLLAQIAEYEIRLLLDYH